MIHACAGFYFVFVTSQVVTWGVGFELHWKTEMVRLFVPASFKAKICGLCGNYNSEPNDDWMVGESCPEDAGRVVTTETPKAKQKYNIFMYMYTILADDE